MRVPRAGAGRRASRRQRSGPSTRERVGDFRNNRRAPLSDRGGARGLLLPPRVLGEGSVGEEAVLNVSENRLFSASSIAKKPELGSAGCLRLGALGLNLR